MMNIKIMKKNENINSKLCIICNYIDDKKEGNI